MSQRMKARNTLEFASVELGGVAYAIVPAATLVAICRQAGVAAVPAKAATPSTLDLADPEELSGANVARRIADRR